MSEASTAVNKHLSKILAQIQTGDYDSAIENIGFVIGDDFEELIEAGMVQDRRSRQGTAPNAITVEHVVLARRFYKRLPFRELCFLNLFAFGNVCVRRVRDQ